MLSVCVVCLVVISVVLLAFNADIASKQTHYVRRKLQESTAGLIPPSLPEILNGNVPPRDPLMMGRAGSSSSSSSIPTPNHAVSEEDALIPTPAEVTTTTTTTITSTNPATNKQNQKDIKTDLPIAREISPSPAPKTASPFAAITISPAHSHMPIEQLPPSGLMKPSGPNQPDINLPDVTSSSSTTTSTTSSSSSSSSSKKAHEANEEKKIDRTEKFIPLTERTITSNKEVDSNRRTTVADQERVDETSPYWSFVQR